MSISMRRIRTRCPTYMSTGLGGLAGTVPHSTAAAWEDPATRNCGGPPTMPCVGKNLRNRARIATQGGADQTPDESNQRLVARNLRGLLAC
jgi:hypothetical protein